MSRLPGLTQVYEAFADAAAELIEQPDALHAELWVSRQLGVLEAAAPEPTAYKAAVADLADHLAAASPEPDTDAFLEVLAAYGLAEAPATEAVHWPDLGRVTPGEAWLIQDGTLGGDRVSLEYRYPGGGAHAVLVRPGPPAEAMVIGDVPGMMAQLRQGVQQEECAVLRLDRATAAARVRETLAEPGDALYPLLAFIRHRLASAG